MCRRSQSRQGLDHDFRQGPCCAGAPILDLRAMTFRDDYRRFLRRAGLAIWATVGLPVFFFQLRPAWVRPTPAIAAWAVSYLLFGVAFAMATARRRKPDRVGRLALMAGQTAAVYSLVALPPCFGLEGALLVLVALQLPAVLPRHAAWTWIGLQSAGLLALVWLHWDWHWGIVLAFAYLPFQLVADATARLLAEETAARERLAAANAELAATRELLAQSARVAERARIARDLHDLLGHHLTALSLNLEIASHKTEGDARARVETAQSVTKLLLGDVRSAVGALRDGDALDLPAALRKLADGIPRPRIHLGVVPDLAVSDHVTGEVVLRCAQEIVTNAVRHAGAENLWLEVSQNGGGIEIRARDDGRPRVRTRAGGHARARRASRRHALRGHRSRARLPRDGGPSSFERLAVIRVFLVEDQALVREGIQSLLALDRGIEVAGTASDGEAALAGIPASGADVVLLDMRLPRLSGIDVLRRLASAGRLPPTIILTTFDDGEALLVGIRAGARGYLLKDVSLSELVRAIRVVAEGGTLVQPIVSERVVRGVETAEADFPRLEPADPLTEREIEVLRLLTGGYSNREIARALKVAEGTVKNHVSSILSKLGVRDRTRAVLQAVRAGYLV
jgi:DNA-binding NarL/FixJ family response regulator/signal transduction histidine kinase